MVTMTDDVGTYHVYVVEGETISPREAGEKLAGFARIAVETGEAKDIGEGLRVACAQHPDLAHIYAAVAIIEGPRNKPMAPTGEDLMTLLKSRYGLKPGREAVDSATTWRDLTNAIYRAVAAEAVRTGANPKVAWELLLLNDRELARVANS